MNRLRSGAIITIPSADDVRDDGAAEATKVVRVQASDWRAYRDRVAAAAPAAEGAGGRAAGGKIGTAVEEKTPAAPAGRDQLRVSREAGQGKGAGAAEEAVARDQALKEAQSRIAELEKTLKDLQRAVELKSQTGAQMQAQADAAKGKAPPPADRSRADAGADHEGPRAGRRSRRRRSPRRREPPKAAEPPKLPNRPRRPSPPRPSRRRPPSRAKAEPPKAEPPKAEAAQGRRRRRRRRRPAEGTAGILRRSLSPARRAG